MREPIQTTRFANHPTPIYSPSRTKLLISVRNAEEAAAIVRKAGVDWIDLKEPKAGSLGRPSLEEAAAVANLLSDYPQRSVALGELHDLDDATAIRFAAMFPVLKAGLSGLCAGGNPTETAWQLRFETLAAIVRSCGAELIPVAYADFSRCDAPSLRDVLQVAKRLRASHLLIDTFVKDGRSLLSWLGLSELSRIAAETREFECGLVLAGSLQFRDASQLVALAPAALAIRGAVCETPSAHGETAKTTDRTAAIDALKVREWCELLAARTESMN